MPLRVLRLATFLIVLGTPLHAAAQSGVSGATAKPSSPETEVRYLSGRGPKDAVPWEFTISAGRRAGQRTTIPVPSNWEQHGFGAYTYGGTTVGRVDEHGHYRTRFRTPASWNGRHIRIVFDGVMTDANVRINGRSAGPVHHGAFYRFRHDITTLLKPAGHLNVLEVDVAKYSANPGTARAEQNGDYWNFGGIFRAVFLEALPAEAIEHVALDARADGSFAADVEIPGVRAGAVVSAQLFTSEGRPFGPKFSTSVMDSAGHLKLTATLNTPRLWTAETPNLYRVRLSLSRGGQVMHVRTQRFGFRTFELRAGQGAFLNGRRVRFKGIGRHSFRPATARALDDADNYADVRLIKQMNMNAVRMTHYPPDVAFLEACDELGLYVIDELSGWQAAHDTANGRTLVAELIRRDVNHPSILMWDNGNEGGWNTALDAEFARHDPQQRAVLHPWAAFSGVDTKHYPSYDDLKRRLAGPNLVMPTEMIHALYDGGGAAGLEDYWNAISASPYGIGGFLWVFADEGIARTDQGGRVDAFSTYAPDGVVGPLHEKEGSFHAIRDLWNPVQIDTPDFDVDGTFHGALTVHNRYDFRSLDGVTFAWRLVSHHAPSRTVARGTLAGPSIAAGTDGALTLPLPRTWRAADALEVTATDHAGQPLWTWSWSILPAIVIRSSIVNARPAFVRVTGDSILMRAPSANVEVNIDARSGQLRSLSKGGRTLALSNGPRLAYARVSVSDTVQWIEEDLGHDAAGTTWNLPAPRTANVIEVKLEYPRSLAWAGFRIEISPDGKVWKTLYDGTRRAGDGDRYEFPPQPVSAIRLSNSHRADDKPVVFTTLRLGVQPARFPAMGGHPPTITTGNDWAEVRGAGGLDRARWTLSAAGELRLDYSYSLEGLFTYHGITFDLPERNVSSMRWLGQGPYRVWQNRLRGTWLGLHETMRTEQQPGESWTYPEFQGFYAGVQWARIATTDGVFTVINGAPDSTWLRIGTPRVSHSATTVAFPAGDLSIMHAIPAIGSKFIAPENSGPRSQPAKASGSYMGSVTFLPFR